MTLYRYTAITHSGEHVSGEVEAQGRDAVMEQLLGLGHFPIDVVARDEAAARGSGAMRLAFWRHPSRAQITLFTRELGMLLHAGMQLDRALSLLERDAESPRLARAIAQVRAAIEQGKSFAQALQAQAADFPPVYTSMIQVSEASGNLDTVLESIAETREREQQSRARVMSALTYPSLLIFVAIGAIIVMLSVVVPQFKAMIDNAGANVPASAQSVIAMSDFLIDHGMSLLYALPVVLAGTALMLRQESVRRAFDAMLLRLPVMGRLMQYALAITFCRTLGTLIESGVDLPVSLGLTREVVSNARASAAIAESQAALRKGQSFAGPLAASGVLPNVVVNMLRIGEETGNLATGLLHMARMFEDKHDMAMRRLLSILEPAIIVFVSLFVATIIFTVIGAVISVNDLAI